jgi:hypothetical protein
MRKVLNLPQFVALEYKRHDTSLNDKSSFRNTTLWRSDKNDGNSRDNHRESRDGSAGGERSSTGSRYPRDKSSSHQRSAWGGRDNKRSFFKSDGNESGHHRNNRSTDDRDAEH